MDIDVLIVIRVLLYGLASFRYAMLLHNESGPWYVFDWLRHKAGIEIYEDEFGNETYIADRFWGELLACPYCLSGWFSIFFTISYYIEKVRPVGDALVIVGAIWGVAYVLLKYFDKPHVR